MQEKKKSALQSVLAFAEDKGFYIILCLCVAAIGVSGYVLFFTGDQTINPTGPIGLESTQVTQPVSNPPAEVTVPVTPPVTEPAAEVGNSGTTITVPQTTEPPTIPARPSTEASKPVTVTTPKYVMPVEGTISRPFSGDELVYDQTMGDWRVHRGLDIDCVDGAPVRALAAGEVSAVFSDEMLGNCVSISHADGFVSTYCGLAVNKSMKTGMKVKAGDEIGLAGNTMLAESGQSYHIHIELTKDGKHVDPMSVLK